MTKQVNPDDVEALVARFQEAKYQELHVRFEGFELYLSNDAAAPGLDGAAPSAAPGPAPKASAEPAAASPARSVPVTSAIEDGMVIVRAPYLGTFYRAPKPGAEHYVETGSMVGPESDLCLVEVMKLFTAVRAGTAGIVRRILAEDGAMVALDQPLFVIEPSA